MRQLRSVNTRNIYYIAIFLFYKNSIKNQLPSMKNNYLTVIAFCFMFTLNLQNTSAKKANDIVPKPVKTTLLKDQKVFLDKNSIIGYQEELSQQALYLSEQLKAQIGINISPNNLLDKVPEIYLTLDSTLVTHPEGYLLTVKNGQIRITANSTRGVVQGMQTLLQLLPTKPKDKVSVEGVEIYDYPNFAYRGMHLDVSRHMFPVDFIKKYIDYLTFHKFNTLHWHLTDDQGWRIEILSYPKLNSIGSWRDETLIGHFTDKPIRYDGKRYGGYYTREEVKDIINYAAIRGIDIIPEADIPGHNRATIAAYPEFSTRPDTTWQVATTWGMFNRQNNVLAPHPETFKFLETIFGEIADLFPSDYIHLGGDECSKKWWKESEQAQKFIKDNDLKDEVGLQTYIVSQTAKYIQAKGKKVIGWDEIIEGDLDTTTIIMNWRKKDKALEAAKRNHHVIMTNSNPLYFNCSQSREPRERCAMQHGYYPLDAVYNYSPITKELSDAGLERYVLGSQACLWTEYIPDTETLEYMIFPRMTALSEVLWVKPENKDFKDFKRRLKVNIIPRYKLWNSNYFKKYNQWTMADDKKKK